MVRDLSVSTLHPRNMRTAVSPAFTRLPKWEMMFWRVFIVAGIFAVPTYVLYHLPDYRNGVNPHKLKIWQMKRQEEKDAAKSE